jgi:CelD/BcsL family acetyltransferase involved in cellulose biosynthesis
VTRGRSQTLAVSPPTGVPAGGSVTVDWIRRVEEMESLAGPWRDLEDRVERRTVFSTFDFLETWYRSYAGEYGGEPLIGVARRDARLIGVAPLVIRRGRLGRVPVTRIQFAIHDAHAGEFLVADEEPALASAFIDSLAEEVRFDVISLIGLDPESAQFAAIRDAARRRHLSLELAGHQNAVVDLQHGYEAYCRGMSRNFRRTLKRQAARIAAMGTPVIDGVQLTTGVDQLERSIERLFAVTEASYKLCGARLADIHRDYLATLARRFGHRGMLHLSLLSLNGEEAAAMMGLVERGCYYDVTLAYAERFAHLSPGSFLIQQVLRTLAGAGVSTVVSHGAHEYKRRWSSRFVSSPRTFLFAQSLRGSSARFIRFQAAPLWRWLRLREP